ncbi:hypothetical protein NQ317_004914 [Molorchus minor]|uniref:Ig-like domain-containing protein n=1 Tax=Molorchus minor TaxID=1323400 RepID=A0ABQ9JJX9_9CUCU|nr:hypothetical protein NQ317_004914 [Molorchus minor]
MTAVIHEGDVCDTSRSYVLAWKRGIAVLTAGPVKVTPDPRVRLLPSPVSSSSLPGIPELSGGGYSLELKDVRPQDAGDYVCQIGTMEPREITHTLEILGECGSIYQIVLRQADPFTFVTVFIAILMRHIRRGVVRDHIVMDVVFSEVGSCSGAYG